MQSDKQRQHKGYFVKKGRIANRLLELKERVFICDCCDLVIDRDLNAALNLAAYARRAETARIACGVEVYECLTMKQEGGETAISSIRPPVVVEQSIAPSNI